MAFSYITALRTIAHIKREIRGYENARINIQTQMSVWFDYIARIFGSEQKVGCDRDLHYELEDSSF